MENKRRGKLYIISGPSGTGKSTIIEKVMRYRPELTFSVSATTRLPRKGDVEGETYYFKTKPQFEEMIKNGELLEYAQFAGNYYGTPIAPILEKMKNGIDTVLDIEVNGYRQIKEKIPEAVSIFIIPPSMEELERRLRSRGTDSDAVIEVRLKTAEKELEQMENYDYIVENDQVRNAVFQVLLIMASTERNEEKGE